MQKLQSQTSLLVKVEFQCTASLSLFEVSFVFLIRWKRIKQLVGCEFAQNEPFHALVTDQYERNYRKLPEYAQMFQEQ